MQEEGDSIKQLANVQMAQLLNEYKQAIGKKYKKYNELQMNTKGNFL